MPFLLTYPARVLAAVTYCYLSSYACCLIGAATRRPPMKDSIHPRYVSCTVTCGCGQSFKTRSTKPELRVEVCSKCHPFFTGQQKFLDTAGRVERFTKKFGGEYFKKTAKKA